jgi:hypothetical protein
LPAFDLVPKMLFCPETPFTLKPVQGRGSVSTHQGKPELTRVLVVSFNRVETRGHGIPAEQSRGYINQGLGVPDRKRLTVRKLGR